MERLVFRLFVSSTFADFEAERGILQRDVFPRLRKQAMAGGARFVPIDLRWGISREAADQQETMEICFKEIERCHAEGQPPRLLALLGHRRGWLPLPPSIPDDVWKNGASALTPPDLARLKRSYLRDDNASPRSWVLQPGADEKSLSDSVKALVRAGCTDEQARRRLLGPATEQELLRAFSGGRQQRREGVDALILVRELDRLPALINATEEPSAKNFLELRKTDDGWAPDESGYQALAALAQELAGQDSSAWAWRKSYQGRWDDARAMIALSERQQRAFADLAFDQLSRMMAASLELERPSQALPREERSHAAVRTRLLASFTGRERELDQFRPLIPHTVPNVPGPPRPVVIVSGPAGSGKSALMAKAAEQAERDCTVIARFAGATQASASAAGLCRSVNLELARLLRIPAEPAAPGDLFAVADLLARERGFHDRRMLVLFIDGVDLIAEQRRPGDRAPTEFRWLPPAMPPQVTLVLSADEDTAPALADWVLAHELIQLGPMSSAGASEMLNQVLRQAGRRLAPGQPEALLERQRDGWLPLPLRVAAQDAIRWPSWAKDPHLPAATTFYEVLGQRLADARSHGEVLVASALGYLLAARDGLSEAELRELLAHDERVIGDLAERFPYYPLPVAAGRDRAVPDAVLSRLLLDLSPYLVEHAAEDEGQPLLRLAHDEFRESASRYVTSTAGGPAAEWHSRVAGYFNEQWPLPRAPAPQFARAVAELPYQFARAGQWDELTAVVTDFGYLEALVTGGAPAGPPRAEGTAEAVWSAAPALAELLALARQVADREPAAGAAAQTAQAVLDAVVRERRNLTRWPQSCWQQLANRLLANPGVPAGLTAELRRQSAQSPRAWLEITSPHASPALAADGPDLPGAVTDLVGADPLGALTVMDNAGTLASWSPAGYESPKVFRRPEGPALAALAPLGDGRVLACDQQGALELWDLPRYRRQPGRVGSLVPGVTAMAYLPGERLLVAATGELTYCWDFDGSAAECRLAGQPRWRSRPGARWLWGLPGGRVLAIRMRPSPERGAPAWEAACLRAADQAGLWRETLPDKPLAAAVDEARGLVALGDSARRVTLRRLETGALERAGWDVGDAPTALAFAPPGPGGDVTLLVGRRDGWLARHAPGGGQLGLLPAHGGPVRAVAVHPQSARVVTGDADGWVRSWDLGAGEWHEFTAARQVRAAAFDTTGRWALACCGSAGSYRIAADGQWTPLAELDVPLDPVLAALPGGRGVVVSLRDGLLGWLPSDQATPRTLPLPPGVKTVTALAGTADGSGVFAADSRGGLSLVPLGDADPAGPATPAGPVRAPGGAPVTALAPAPDGQGLLAGDAHGQLTTWTAGGPHGLVPGPRWRTKLAGITALAVAPGHGAVAGSRHGEVVLVHDGREVRLDRHGAPVTSVAVGLGGRVAVTAAGGGDPALCVWALDGGEKERLVARLPLPDDPVAVVFLPNQLELAVLDRHGRLRSLRLHLPDRWATIFTGTE
jgi:WD40 repeat protein